MILVENDRQYNFLKTIPIIHEFCKRRLDNICMNIYLKKRANVFSIVKSLVEEWISKFAKINHLPSRLCTFNNVAIAALPCVTSTRAKRVVKNDLKFLTGHPAWQ